MLLGCLCCCCWLVHSISKFWLGKEYYCSQLFAALLTLGGIFLSLGTTWQATINGTDSIVTDAGYIYTVLFALGGIPAVCLNVLVEDVLKEVPSYSVAYLLAWESLYQFLFVTLCFWVDILPGFGFAENVGQFWDFFSGGWECSFGYGGDKCQYAFIMGFLFCVSYIVAYFYAALMMKHASANMYSLTIALANPIVVFFWFIFPAVSSWADASELTTADIAFASSALVPLSVGVYLFRRAEKQHKDQEKENEKKEKEKIQRENEEIQ